MRSGLRRSRPGDLRLPPWLVAGRMPCREKGQRDRRDGLMDDFELHGREFVALCDLLKLTGSCSSGGAAKTAIAAGLVRVDGEVELRKRCKIRPGQVVTFAGRQTLVR